MGQRTDKKTEVVEAPSPVTSQGRLDRDLGNLLELTMSLVTAGGVGLDELERCLPTQNILRFHEIHILKNQ